MKHLNIIILLAINLLATTLHAATLSGEATAHPAALSVEQAQRLQDWRDFISAHRQASVQEILHSANRYLNRYPYVKDGSAQGATERWATPYEFIVNNGGDCEDFAIAKYFLLSELGIPAEELQITYVYHRRLQQYHMVLLYSPAQANRALVMDNLSDEIQHMADRTELAPVYGFNQQNLWVINGTAFRTKAGPATRLSRWRELMFRRAESPLLL